MHPTALNFGKSFFDLYCKDLTDATVVDIGSQNVNGSLKDVCPPALKYVGVDFVVGNGVDIVLEDPYKLPFDDESVDVVVCSSCFEHSDFFWLLFLEVLRILKPEGLFYLNAPSNGYFHKYPTDSWRFYPDSGKALVAWAARNGFVPVLLESFVGAQGEDAEDKWNDFVAVFGKTAATARHRKLFMMDGATGFSNGYRFGSDETLLENIKPQDKEILENQEERIAAIKQELAEREERLERLSQTVAERDEKISAYHDEVISRDETIIALNQAIAERDGVIQKIYCSRSWRITKPVRYVSRVVRKTLNLISKLTPSKIMRFHKLTMPHLFAVLRNPRRLKSKLHQLNIAWKSNGYQGVISKLQQVDPSANIPLYNKFVDDFMHKLAYAVDDIINIDQVFVIARQYRQDNRKVLLFITHNYGGGTEKHVQELASALSENNVRILFLRPSNDKNGCDVTLSTFDQVDRVAVDLSSRNIELLAAVLNAFAIKKVHIHHTIGFNFAIEELVLSLGRSYDITIHDFYAICPLINLGAAGKGYCGAPTSVDCNACLALEPARAGGIEIIWWRARFASLLNGASTVYCPSFDTARRILEHYPAAPVKVVPHEDIEFPPLRYARTVRTVRRIAILGVLAAHKGLILVEEALAATEKDRHPIEFILIGYPETKISASKSFTQTGPYDDSKLLDIIDDIDPDAIWFPAVCPETYSYTLTAAILSGRPIIVANIGSLPERVKDISNAFIYPFQFSGSEFANYVLTLQLSLPENERVAAIGEYSERHSRQGNPGKKLNKFYVSSEYLLVRTEDQALGGNARKRPVIVVIPEMYYGSPSPCSYIRLLMPLMSPEFNAGFELRIATLKTVLTIAASAVIINRVPCEQTSELNELFSYLHSSGAKLVYDVDDNLLNLPDTHPESKVYSNRQEVVKKLLSMSDLVWVSTHPLAEVFALLCKKVSVFENYLDLNHFAHNQPLPVKNGFNILYMGSATHAADLNLVLDALNKLYLEGEEFTLNLIGVSVNIPPYSWISVIQVPESAGNNNYPEFMRWLRSFAIFDLGIAPLVENDFNRCKSAIKFWDYTSIGIPTLASDVEPYSNIILHDINGLLATNNTEEWYSKLKYAINNDAALSNIAAQAISTLENMHRKINGANGRRKSINCLLNAIDSIDESGLSYSSCDDRIDRKSIAEIFLFGDGIEIGALHNPLAIPQNARAKYVDRMPKEQLYEHYPELRSLPLVEVDIVDNGELLNTISDNSQDFVVANHFLEHAEDPITAVINFIRVIKVGGIVYLAVPNMTKTFDSNRKETSLSHLIADHKLGIEISRRNHYEEWVSLVEPNFGRSYHGSQFDSRVAELLAQKYSIHFHCWTEIGFKNFLSYLSEDCTLSFDISLYSEHGDECVVILKKK